MIIKYLYEMPSIISNSKLSALVYKFNKGLLNVLYPLIVKPQHGIDKHSNIVVSLTSFPARINTVWITIMTLLNQTVKPKAIILWLAEEQFPNREKDLPYKLLQLKKYGLSIRFCENLYPHKKYYYSMKAYPHNSIITVDDDILYPEYLIEELEKLNNEYPECVCCTWAHEITEIDGKIAPYQKWKHGIKTGGKPSYKLLPVGCGGVLYPANVLDERVFDIEQIKSLCLKADDLWLKAMAVSKGTKAVRWRKATPIFYSIQGTKTSGLFNENVGKNKNDEVMELLSFKYPSLTRLLFQ